MSNESRAIYLRIISQVPSRHILVQRAPYFLAPRIMRWIAIKCSRLLANTDFNILFVLNMKCNNEIQLKTDLFFFYYYYEGISYDYLNSWNKHD